MHYLEDFRQNWRPLLGAALGLGSGMAMTSFILPVFAPHLLAEFGWPKADFAMVGVASVLVLFSIPLVGRMTDLFGVWKVAAVGVAVTPLTYVALSLQSGSIYQYLAILAVQMTLCATSTATVYTRLIVQYFERSRGGALAVTVSAPAIVGALGSPLIAMVNQDHGWRAGFLVIAGWSAAAGVLALALIPRDGPAAGREPARDRPTGDYGEILRNPTFWYIFLAAFLVSLPQILTNSQLALVLMDKGASAEGAGRMVALFAMGVVVGRIAAGLALDRYEAEIVGLIGLSLPGFGMFLIASSLDQPMALGLAVLLIGLAFGAEGDVIAYIIVKHFGVRIYGTVIGLTFAAIGGAATFGAVALSQSLRLTGDYNAFLLVGGVGVLLGSLLFLLVRRRTPLVPAAA
ncbi:MFS transporter [Sphingobium sufflavum]|uniref:MFS transporter n=1 Tax=Sphingobium sufflavum TaxID=1129547 RepID=UPI001F488E4A|nr:MFS transporter [Sphingobium sufflavum]MCE7797080.1 MFS transporter [Sphingobium sufflavum]